jgi:hypothetical protein
VVSHQCTACPAGHAHAWRRRAARP